jgi:hypothetical protein
MPTISTSRGVARPDLVGKALAPSVGFEIGFVRMPCVGLPQRDPGRQRVPHVLAAVFPRDRDHFLRLAEPILKGPNVLVDSTVLDDVAVEAG